MTIQYASDLHLEFPQNEEFFKANQWQIEKGMSDFQVIKYKGSRFSAEQFNQLHAGSIKFLEQVLHHNYTDKSVVATHHVPTFLNYPEKFKGDALNEAFAVELFDLIETNGPDFWIYGHTHSNISDFEIGKTCLKTNQLGYVKYNEQFGYQNERIIKL